MRHARLRASRREAPSDDNRMSRLRQVGLTIDAPLAPAAAKPTETPQHRARRPAQSPGAAELSTGAGISDGRARSDHAKAGAKPDASDGSADPPTVGSRLTHLPRPATSDRSSAGLRPDRLLPTEPQSPRTGRSAARGRVWSNPRRSAKHMRQAVDRDHQNVVLDALDAPRTDEAHDAKGTVACPSSPAP